MSDLRAQIRVYGLDCLSIVGYWTTIACPRSLKREKSQGQHTSHRTPKHHRVSTIKIVCEQPSQVSAKTRVTPHAGAESDHFILSEKSRPAKAVHPLQDGKHNHRPQKQQLHHGQQAISLHCRRFSSSLSALFSSLVGHLHLHHRRLPK
jgi:hypothetical protein